MKASELLSVQKINKIIHSVPSSGRSIVSAVIRRVGRSISHFRWFRVFWKCARDFNSIWIKSFNSSERNLWNFFFVTNAKLPTSWPRQTSGHPSRPSSGRKGRVGVCGRSLFSWFFCCWYKKKWRRKTGGWPIWLPVATALDHRIGHHPTTLGRNAKISSALQCDSIINLDEWMANFWTSQTLTCPPFSTPRHSHYWG